MECKKISNTPNAPYYTLRLSRPEAWSLYLLLRQTGWDKSAELLQVAMESDAEPEETEAK